MEEPHWLEVSLNERIDTFAGEKGGKVTILAELSDDVAVVGRHQDLQAAYDVVMIDLSEQLDLLNEEALETFGASSGEGNNFESYRTRVGVISALEDLAGVAAA